ncbi:BZ3500_MvSof-1268-A1-R1_Chr9g10778 [Microbotryum saponariae]|uniref:BZ3500_MvSof-1268-A1-R1_Chr9g10778 protein n=1 Tax=Microbotryum saponariae TaxID=289078 RepID=A0A2X0KBS9_9BASI|nr:BZ3501_MvSof-1269-A2-R1_Chr9g10526 [Microbotryum saponariae]SDA00674.1 BZ3500_MvSof-1268-A1-R1_Chr9g10778 [Microbotryum saponariae]
MPRLRRTPSVSWSPNVTTTNMPASGSDTSGTECAGPSRRRGDVTTRRTTRSRSKNETRHKDHISRNESERTPYLPSDGLAPLLIQQRPCSPRSSSSPCVPPTYTNPTVFLLLALTTLLIIAPPPVVQAFVPHPRAVIPGRSEPSPPLPPGSTRVGNYVCRSQGECEPCPADEIFSSVCSLYGNRKKLICERSLSTSESPSSLEKNLKDPFSNPNPSQTTPQEKDSNDELDSVMEIESDSGDGSRGAGAAVDKLIGDEDADPSAFSSFDNDPEPDALDGVRMRGRAVMDDQDGPDEIVTWEACQRVVKKEKEDYYEFILCNLFFATGSIALLMYRHRVLASRQYGRLAARIGLSVTR